MLVKRHIMGVVRCYSDEGGTGISYDCNKFRYMDHGKSTYLYKISHNVFNTSQGKILTYDNHIEYHLNSRIRLCR